MKIGRAHPSGIPSGGAGDRCNRQVAHVSAIAWRWPIFSPAEIARHGTGKLLMNEAALDAVQAFRYAGQAADRAFGLPQPRVQPGGWRRQGVEASEASRST